MTGTWNTPPGWDSPQHFDDQGAPARPDRPKVPNGPRHQASSLTGTMRISEMVGPPKIPPGSGWRKLLYELSFRTLNLGESPAERRYRQLSNRIRQYIRRQYVIGVVSGKGGVGKTTMSTCIGSVFRECRPDTVVAIDAVPGYGTLAGRIEQTPRSSFAGFLSDTEIQGYTDIRQYLGQNDVGLDVLAGEHMHNQPPVMLPTMLNGALTRLRRSHTVLVIDTSDDLAHPVMRTVFDACDTLVFVSGLTADTSLPVSRTIDVLRAMGYNELVSRSTIILNDSRNRYDSSARAYLAQGYAHSGLTVEFMPYDPHLAKGGVIDTKYGLKKKSRLRLFEITAALADKYNLDADVPGRSRVET